VDDKNAGYPRCLKSQITSLSLEASLVRRRAAVNCANCARNELEEAHRNQLQIKALGLAGGGGGGRGGSDAPRKSSPLDGKTETLVPFPLLSRKQSGERYIRFNSRPLVSEVSSGTRPEEDARIQRQPQGNRAPAPRARASAEIASK